MKRVLSLFLTIHIIFSCAAQEVLFEKEIRLKKGLIESREAYPLMNEANQNLSFFLIDKSTIKALLFDKNLEIIDTLEGPKPDSKFSDLLGSNISGDLYNLFFASRSHTSFTIVSFDFTNNKVSHLLLDLPVKKERYAGCGSYKGKFYLFTITKASSILKLYALDARGSYGPYTYDFKAERFAPVPLSTLFDALFENPLTFVDNEIPNSIDLVSKKNKLYGHENNLVITLDNLSGKTIVITVDLATFGHDLQFFEKARTEEGTVSTSNSYLYGNQLYQFIVCPTEMIFSIASLANGEIANEFRVTKDDDIYFKNTAIIQEGSTFGADVLSKTKQFLRKVSGSEAGISVYKTAAGLEVMLGGYKEIQGGGGGGGMMMGGTTIGTPYGSVSTAPVYNPTFNGYNAYKSSKSVYFKSLLSPSTFDHQEGGMPKNIFDRIQLFTKALEGDITGETLFKKDNACILGYYLKANQRYVMRMFKD